MPDLLVAVSFWFLFGLAGLVLTGLVSVLLREFVFSDPKESPLDKARREQRVRMAWKETADECGIPVDDLLRIHRNQYVDPQIFTKYQEYQLRLLEQQQRKDRLDEARRRVNAGESVDLSVLASPNPLVSVSPELAVLGEAVAEDVSSDWNDLAQQIRSKDFQADIVSLVDEVAGVHDMSQISGAVSGFFARRRLMRSEAGIERVRGVAKAISELNATQNTEIQRKIEIRQQLNEAVLAEVHAQRKMAEEAFYESLIAQGITPEMHFEQFKSDLKMQEKRVELELEKERMEFENKLKVDKLRAFSDLDPEKKK